MGRCRPLYAAFKAKSEWNVSFDLRQNGNFSSHVTGRGKGGEDQFEVK